MERAEIESEAVWSSYYGTDRYAKRARAYRTEKRKRTVLASAV
jgi:hypothetical protein